MDVLGAPEEPTAPLPSRRAKALAALALGVGVLVTIGLFSIGPAATNETDPNRIDRLLDPEATAALETVERFAAALAADEPAAAVAIIDADWVVIDLPAMPVGMASIASPFRRDEVLALFAEIVDLELGRCRVDSPNPARSAQRVTCPEATARGPYAAAVGVADLPAVMVFTVHDGRIVSVHRSPSSAPQPAGLCEWAESTRPDTAIGLFDLRCRPIPGQGNGATLTALAKEFLAAGRPGVDPSFAAARAAVVRVLGFERFLAAGLPLDGLFAPDADVSQAPWAAAAPDGLEGFLDWTEDNIGVDLGVCRLLSPIAGDLAEVGCSAAVVQGPALSANGLERAVTPLAFTLRGGLIVRLGGEAIPALTAG